LNEKGSIFNDQKTVIGDRQKNGDFGPEAGRDKAGPGGEKGEASPICSAEEFLGSRKSVVGRGIFGGETFGQQRQSAPGSSSIGSSSNGADDLGFIRRPVQRGPFSNFFYF
jgi:hypothetical protein